MMLTTWVVCDKGGQVAQVRQKYRVTESMDIHLGHEGSGDLIGLEYEAEGEHAAVTISVDGKTLLLGSLLMTGDAFRPVPFTAESVMRVSLLPLGVTSLPKDQKEILWFLYGEGQPKRWCAIVSPSSEVPARELRKLGLIEAHGTTDLHRLTAVGREAVEQGFVAARCPQCRFLMWVSHLACPRCMEVL